MAYRARNETFLSPRVTGKIATLFSGHLVALDYTVYVLNKSERGVEADEA